jgi:hypothetical protein
MNFRRTLTAFMRVVADEAEKNSEFGVKVRAALEGGLARSTSRENRFPDAAKRPKNRRAPAVLDPIQLARQGESVLRTELARLGVEQLRDIVAEYGMDPGKLVLKWREPSRIIDRIVEVAMNRAQKGSAFR